MSQKVSQHFSHFLAQSAEALLALAMTIRRYFVIFSWLPMILRLHQLPSLYMDAYL